MGVIRRTPSSRRDFANIWDYVAEHAGSGIADRLLRAMEGKLQMLSDHPYAGPQRPELRPRLRSFAVGNYILFYRPVTDGIELIRVLHGARDLRALFR